MTFLRTLAALTLCGVASCHLPKPKYDSAFNPEREKMGLELLPADWKPMSVDKDFTIWRVPVINEAQPQLFSITASYDKARLVSEVDRYYSGGSFITIDGKNSEALDIGYYFVEKVMGLDSVKGWRCEYSGAFSPEDKKDTAAPVTHYTTTISLVQADSILRAWGLKAPVRR
jgi:hypothetical protein